MVRPLRVWPVPRPWWQHCDVCQTQDKARPDTRSRQTLETCFNGYFDSLKAQKAVIQGSISFSDNNETKHEPI